MTERVQERLEVLRFGAICLSADRGFIPLLEAVKTKRVLVDEWIESSINRAEFCRMKGINTSTFDGWLNRFYPEREKKTCERSSGLVKIQSAAQERELAMEYGGAKIRFCQSALKDVIQVLKAVNG